MNLEQNPNSNSQELNSKKQQLKDLETKSKELIKPLPLDTQITILQKEIQVLTSKSTKTKVEEKVLEKEAKDSANLLGKELDSETPILTLLKKNSEGITFSDIVGKKKIEKSMLSDPDVHIKKYDIISIKMDGFSSFNLNHAVVYLGEKKIVHISGSGNYFTGSDR
ncbi:1565_t:CDS:2 [Funneliformis geosporum]|uniref:1565_t:CDS:1 n=1 Tax=Funneliformis geosporum TaxID=1117311 RepID=A0A9W4SF41_9GLOM|nr:1565_t:CDS:2 [Funneliformis geosporum]